MRSGLPILLNVSERVVVIVGGGAVAARKARNLVSAGASRIRAVAPQFHDELPAHVERVQETYHEKHLDDAQLVFAATDVTEVNTRVVHDARRRGILVSRADEDDSDDQAAGDFVSPAVHRDGPVTVAVSASSAALSGAIRDGVASRFDARWVRMAEAMRVLRPRVRDASRLSAARRRSIFRDLASEDALGAAVAGPDEVWKWLVAWHPDLTRD